MNTLPKLLLTCLVLATGCNGNDGPIVLQPGDTVTVTTPKAAFAGLPLRVTREEAADVVRALEILARYAPSKYKNDFVLTGSVTSTGIYWADRADQLRKTAADELRDQAKRLVDSAKEKREQADRLDKEQLEIEWARSVLAKWKERLES